MNFGTGFVSLEDGTLCKSLCVPFLGATPNTFAIPAGKSVSLKVIRCPGNCLQTESNENSEVCLETVKLDGT